MELRGWRIVFAGVENFFLFNTAFSLAAFIVASLLRRSRLMWSWSPRASAHVYIAALVVPPIASAWLVCASLFPATWLADKVWAQEHAEEHSLHLLNAFTIVADPTGFRLGSQRLSDCEFIFRKPNRSGVSNNLLSNRISRGASEKFTIAEPW